MKLSNKKQKQKQEQEQDLKQVQEQGRQKNQSLDRGGTDKGTGNYED